MLEIRYRSMVIKHLIKQRSQNEIPYYKTIVSAFGQLYIIFCQLIDYEKYLSTIILESSYDLLQILQPPIENWFFGKGKRHISNVISLKDTITFIRCTFREFR